MCKVEHHVGRVSAGKSVAVHADASSGSEFDKNISIVKSNGVIARRSSFILVLKASGFATGWKTVIYKWQQEDVAVIGDAGAAEMRMAETVDFRIRVVITGATIPTCEPCIRAELDHAERNDRAGECVAVTGSADEGIDVAREISLCEDLKR